MCLMNQPKIFSSNQASVDLMATNVQPLRLQVMPEKHLPNLLHSESELHPIHPYHQEVLGRNQRQYHHLRRRLFHQFH
jgi:hypothetical protein